MKNTLLLLIIAMVGSTIYCQDQDLNVIAPLGDFNTYEGGSISWTLGETFIDTYSTDGTIITQGFQQSGLTIESLYVNTNQSIEMKLYPNPTPGIIYLNTEVLENLSYQLLDISGKTLVENEIKTNIEAINMLDLPASTYILRVLNDEELLKSYQIIKK